MKKFAAGFLSALLLMCTTVFAEDTTKMIEVVFNSIHIQVNGANVDANNMIYDGVTYVPLRAVSEMLDKDVVWDDSANTVNINDKIIIDQNEIENENPNDVNNESENNQNTDGEQTVDHQVYEKPETVISLYNESINIDEYDFYLKAAKAQTESEAAAKGVKNLMDTKIDKKKVESLIKDKALDLATKDLIQFNKALEYGIELTPEEIQAMEDQKNKNIEKAGGRGNFERILHNMGMTEETYMKRSQFPILFSKLYDKVISEDPRYQITDLEMAVYYGNNIEMFRGPLQVRAKHILVKTTDENEQPLTGDALEQAKIKIGSLYIRIKQGENFEKLMEEFSEDPGLKLYPDGYMFYRNGQMVKAFEDAAFELNRGQISDIIQSEQGYHIIKVEEKTEYASFVKVKDLLHKLVIRELYDEQIETWKKEADININTSILENLGI